MASPALTLWSDASAQPFGIVESARVSGGRKNEHQSHSGNPGDAADIE